MKALFVACLLLSQISSAAIYHSGYESRHLDVIEAAIAKACNVSTDVVTQKSTLEETVRVDNGIKDVYYTTVFEIRNQIDQNLFESQKIVVKSVLADMYDHQAQQWGTYSVESVDCSAQ